MDTVSELRELITAFVDLSVLKQSWLITRFPGCDTDKEALEKTELTKSVLDSWKRQDKDFATCYSLMYRGIPGWEKALTKALEEGNALIAALELRKMLQTPWKDTEGARWASAKATMINQALGKLERKDAKDVKKLSWGDIDPDA